MLYPDEKVSFADFGLEHSAPGWCSLDWLSGFLDTSVVSEKYRTAADLLVDAVDENLPDTSTDAMFLPVMYLYRHSIELELKSCVSSIFFDERRQGKITKDKILRRHELLPLWRIVEEYCYKRWPNEDGQVVDNVDSLINELHQMDPNGQSFRYHTNKKGVSVTGSYPSFSNLYQIQAALGAVLNFLSGVSSSAYEELVRDA